MDVDSLLHRKRLLRGWVFVLFALVILLLVLQAAGRIDWPRSRVLGLIFAGVLFLNVGWWLRADLRLTDSLAPASRRRVRILLALYMALLCLPVPWIAPETIPWERLPVPAAMWLQLWHMGIVVLVPVGTAVGVVVWLAVRTRRLCLSCPASPQPETVDPPPSTSAPAADDPPRPSRRAFLQRTLVAAPIALTGAGTVAGAWQIGRFQVRRHTIAPPGLPTRLKGLTFTHLSDFHVGRLFRIDHLRRVVDAANALDSDVVVITGDIIDNDTDVLPATVEALRGLRHRHGLFLCYGNHDLMDEGPGVQAYFRRSGLAMLVNERRVVEIGGENLLVGGMMWARHDNGSLLSPGHEQLAEATFGPAIHQPRRLFTVALAHHPHAFDATARRRVALTLSGHTHGGQLMLTPPGQPAVGAGNLLFRYIRGFFTADGTPGSARPWDPAISPQSERPVLFVNTGAGNWFPFRINAPAEIVQLRLV